MDDKKGEPKKESCERCGWMEFKPLPYGAIDYLCANRKEPIASAVLTKRRCAQFKP